MANVLVLESDPGNQEEFRHHGFTGKIVGTAVEAMRELSLGDYQVFRTNYINDDIWSSDAAVLYAREAIRVALAKGINIEVGTVNDAQDVIDSLREYDIPYDENKIHIFNRYDFAPGESFEGPSRKNERI